MLFSVFRELARVASIRGAWEGRLVCSRAQRRAIRGVFFGVGVVFERTRGDLRRRRDERQATSDARFGLQCLRALLEGNTQRVFKLVESAECSYELACCLERHFPVLRVEALRSMNASMNATPMSLDELARVLRFDDARDAETYAKACGLSVDDETRSVSFRTLPFTYPNLRHPDARRETSRAVVPRGRQALSTDRRASAARHFHPSRVVDREDVRDTEAIDMA